MIVTRTTARLFQRIFSRPKGIDGGEDSLSQIVCFQQATELEQDRCI